MKHCDIFDFSVRLRPDRTSYAFGVAFILRPFFMKVSCWLLEETI
jgi:hypothetical protein